MLWFRLASGIFLIIVLIWTMGVTVGVVQMCSYGASIKSMVDDPTRNGTISVYVTLISVETFIFFITLFGMYIAFRVWRNNYQIDHSLRHQFIIWLACWGVGFVFCLVIGIYMIIKSKDSQENMAVLYDTFFRNSQDQKFVATFEKFQRENQCCGIYTPNDWFIIQFRQRSGGIAGGGGGGGFQDYDGYNQNPSTGKCHLTPPTLPPGCGTKLNDEIQFIMKIYAACAITHTILGAFTGGLFWYCFFYWLDKEVIVIPEDEVSNLIIIEPESEATIIISSSSSNISTSGYLSSRSRVHAGSYFNRDSRGSYLPGSRIGGSSRLTSGMRSTRDGSHLRHGSYIQHSPVRSHSQHHTEHHHHHSHPHKIHLSHTALLHEQEQALGGHVLAEMHVNHGSTKMLQAKGSNAGQHHATVALVRNRNPPPKNDLHLGKGQHGQTGNLAKDIVDMSGNSAKGYIEDVVIPPEVPGKKPHAIQIPIGASVHSRSPTPSHSRQDIQKNINATSIQDKLEDLIHVFSHDHEDKKKSHKSVVIERKDHHRHHQKHPKDHNVDHELSEPRLLPPIGSHESSLNDHHQHHHHEHGNPHHHGSHHRDHGSQFHHHVSQHHQDHHHSHHHQDHHLDHHHSRHQHSHHQHHGNVRGEHHHPHVDLNGSILGQNHVLSSSRHGPHHHGSRSGGNHRPDHERYLHAGHEHHHHDRYPQYGGYHGHGQYSPTNSRTHHHHPHGRRASSVNANRYSPYRGRSKDFRYGTTTVLFKNPKDLDDSD